MSRGRLLELYRNYLRVLARTLIGRELQAKLDASDLVRDILEGPSRVRSVPRRRGGRTDRLAEEDPRPYVGEPGQAPSRPRPRRATPGVLGGGARPIEPRRSGGARRTFRIERRARAVRREEAVLLADALERLPDDYREVFILRNLEQIPVEQVAERMGRSVNAVRNSGRGRCLNSGANLGEINHDQQ